MLPEHLLSVPFVEVITRHVGIIGCEYFDVSLVQNRAKDQLGDKRRCTKCTLHDVDGCSPPFNNKHICVDKFSCRRNIDAGARGRDQQ